MSSMPETKAALTRLKASWSRLMREYRLAVAQRQATKAMFAYMRDGCPKTALMIGSALSHSIDESDRAS